MPAPNLNSVDYASSLQRLLPTGRVWPREAGATLPALTAGLSQIHARIHARAADALRESYPPTVDEMLPEWEAALGLPDPCAGPLPTAALRRAAVVARFAGRGGQSVPYYTAYALNLGFVVTVEEFAPARAGMLRAGGPCCGADWAHTWRVHAPAQTVVPFVAGIGRAGEPLAAWGNLALQCSLGRIRPAHTVLQIAYGS